MSERGVSAESDSETLGRAGREGEKVEKRVEAGLLRRGYRHRYCVCDDL